MLKSWLESFFANYVLKLLTPAALAEAEAFVKQFFVDELVKLASKTPTDIDDQVIARIAELLDVTPTADAPTPVPKLSA